MPKSATSLYEAQQEIKKLFLGKEVDPSILSDSVCEELKIYKSLVLSSIQSLLKNIYPLCYKFLETKWSDITLLYIETYPSDSAVFNHAAKDFPEFLNSEPFKAKFSGLTEPYLAELALYEWLELEIYHYEEMEEHNSELSLVEASCVCPFSMPITEIVASINENFSDLEMTKTKIQEILAQHNHQISQVLIYRSDDDFRVHFLKLAPTTAFVITLIDEGCDFDEICLKTIEQLKISEEHHPKIKKDLKALIEDLKNKKALARV